jgi:hypothetical protein
MERANLDAALLYTNLMMNVNRGIDEVSLLIDDEPIFLQEEDADEYFQMATEFDFITESFRVWERRYKKNEYVNFQEVDLIANYLDLFRNYFENVNKLF